MNTFQSNPGQVASSRGAGRGAFTLPEMMVVIAIFSFLVGALVATQIFGMRMQRMAETKLSATATARKALNQMRNEIRSGKVLYVGSGSSNSFAAITNGQQIGNALQIRSTQNPTPYIRYYLDTNSNTLNRVTDTSTQALAIANFITNRLIFHAEDFQGNVLTNDQNNRVISVTLEFYRWEYPIAIVGQGGMYDYYRLQTRITRRTID